jgi:hypothetical protein
MVDGREGKQTELGCTRNAVDGYYHPSGGDVFVRRSWTLCLEIFGKGTINTHGVVPLSERFWTDN